MRTSTAKASIDLIFKVLPFLTATILMVSFYFARVEESSAFNFSKEDGFLEWGTVFFFICCACLSVTILTFNELVLSRSQKRFLAIFALLLIVGIGEELSWGKRIFGWEVPAMVAEIDGNLVQTDDTSLHNLRLKFSWGHVNPSDLVFSFFLPIGLLLQGIILPWNLNRNNLRARKFVAYWGFFVPSLKLGTLLFVCAFLFHRLKSFEGVTDVREYEEFIIPFIFSFVMVDYYFKNSPRHWVFQGILISSVFLWLIASLLFFSQVP
jgi:hypothetical protein